MLTRLIPIAALLVVMPIILAQPSIEQPLHSVAQTVGTGFHWWFDGSLFDPAVWKELDDKPDTACSYLSAGQKVNQGMWQTGRCKQEQATP